MVVDGVTERYKTEVVDGKSKMTKIEMVAIRDPHGEQYFSPVSTFEQHFSGEVVVVRK